MAWMNKNETEFALLKNVKSSVKNFIGKKIVHQLADLKSVSERKRSFQVAARTAPPPLARPRAVGDVLCVAHI